MTDQAAIIIGLVAGGVAVVTLLAAWLVSWSLARAGRGLREVGERLDGRVTLLPANFDAARRALDEVRPATERVLWRVVEFDERSVDARVQLLSARLTADELRGRLLENRARLSRLRDLTPLILRALATRRTFLG